MMDLIVLNVWEEMVLYLELGQIKPVKLALAMLFVAMVLLAVANLGIMDLHAFNVRLGLYLELGQARLVNLALAPLFVVMELLAVAKLATTVLHAYPNAKV